MLNWWVKAWPGTVMPSDNRCPLSVAGLFTGLQRQPAAWAQSEDLAQETFVAAWKQLAGLREPEKLRA